MLIAFWAMTYSICGRSCQFMIKPIPLLFGADILSCDHTLPGRNKVLCSSGLGIHARVFATVLGPRTKRWRMYSEHEVIGAAMLETLNADPLTVEIVRGEGQPEVQAALRQADTI